MSSSFTTIKVGYVPEHFSTPLFFAAQLGLYEAASLQVELKAFPSGSGHMIQSLQSQEIDVAIGLTEAFVAGIGKGAEWYKIVGTYVESPLCWAISAGRNRSDMLGDDDLQGKTIGISRIGSGSYVMPFVLASQKGWTEGVKSEDIYKFAILDNFANLRDGVNEVHSKGVNADAFMWEIFTTKKYYDNGEIKNIGQIYTPWPSWVISASTRLTETAEGRQALNKLFKCINQGVEYFNKNPQNAVEYIANNLDYSAEDARAWLKTVRFVDNVAHIDQTKVIDNTFSILKTAGVLDSSADDKIYTVSI
ncbi:periplasmic binding protein-like II [Nadsonia fulvescens var. elongata DSM 6958]|uniref:Periplasmic binding protein-like II n=1 Tax=Nadsonia fulvescens var. elongata DSM 6958 TaxID=857566 RepID=A0A1E3PIF0_9ASCO|nr:periplasmic binding protein-like II [Nadsonia fulvescens var. elongata DSM 6958]